ncbi:MAG: choice-of-anchor L domain-containing protein [Bacteroidota bacterium]
MYVASAHYRFPLPSKRHYLLACFLVFFSSAWSQLSVTPNPSLTTLINALGGQGLTISNPQLNCPAGAYGTFTTGVSNLGLPNGILLTTGSAMNAVGPNNLPSAGTCNGTISNDPQLNTIEPLADYDLCVLEFDIIPQCSTLTIRFVFGSEEYPEFVNSSFNDAFGFFITGPGPYPNCQNNFYNNTNVATLPNNITPVTIDNVNNIVNSTYYVNNTNGTTVQYDGFTTVLTRTVQLCPCQQYHFKIAIADAGDCIYDSGVFIDFMQCSSVLTATTTSVNAGCNGCVGSATATASGTIGPYTYSWTTTPAQTTATATGLCPGTYTVYVNDALSCTPAITSVVTISGSPPMTTTQSGTNVTCFGGNNGTATVTPSGAQPPYSYSWTTTPVQTTQTATGLTAGTYTVTVTSSNGCTAQQVVTITQPPALSLTSSQVNLLCNAQCNGSATVNVSGGTPGYTYAWSPSGGNGATAGNLCAGNYICTVTDANGCSITQSFTITQPPALSASIIGNINPSCFGGSNGSAAAQATGGTPNYTYSWAPAGGSGATGTGLSAGSYTCYITDANGCTTTTTVTLGQPTALTIQAQGFAETCAGACDGQVVCIPSGGTTPYTYSWNNGCNTPGCMPVCSGTYTIFVTDANGCTIQDTAIVNSPPGITLTTSSVQATCNLPNGSASVTATGGSGNYTYSWTTTPVQNGSTANGIPGGTYTVVVSDGNGCTASATIVVPSAPAVTSSLTSQTNINCFGACNGSATVTAGSGTPPYTYSWTTNPVQNTAAANGLCAGTYTCYVTDANNCVDTTIVTITQPGPLQVNASQNQSICSGSSVTISGLAQGGTPAYTYAWAPTGTGTSFTDSPGATTTYTLTVTDANGCTDTAMTTVTVNAAPVFTIAANDNDGCVTHCVTFSSSLTNGTSYSWDFGDGSNTTGSGPVHCYTVPGTYTVVLTIADANGCSATVTVNNMIIVYAMPVAEFNMSSESASIIEPTIAFTNASAGASLYSWDFGDPASGASNTSTLEHPSHTFSDTGTFCITLWVESPNGCRDSISYCLVIEPDFTFYAPNAITPDGDGINDGFLPKGTGWDPANYTLYVFDRWGNMIFQTDDMNKHWDGRVQGQPDIVQEDTYVWKVVLKDFRGTQHQYVGHVSVIR